MYVKSHIQTLINFLADHSRWTKGHWAKNAYGQEQVNVHRGTKFCLIGAISYLFPEAKKANAVKTYLEQFLYINAHQYLRADVFSPPKDKGPRWDWGNLAKFNDESEHAWILAFLADARDVAVSFDTMRLLAK